MAENTGARQTEQIPVQTGKLKVVVADDEHLVAMGLAQSLRSLGHDVSAIAADGEDAVSKIRDHAPDLALLDIQMPKMNGTEVAMLVFEELAVPSMIISAYSDDEYLKKIYGYGASSGVYGYLIKPVAPEDLRVGIAVAIQRAAIDAHRNGRIAQLERNLLNRRTVEQAKWKMVDKLKITEAIAHDRLQRVARDRRLQLVDIARAVIERDELMDGKDPHAR